MIQALAIYICLDSWLRGCRRPLPRGGGPPQRDRARSRSCSWWNPWGGGGRAHPEGGGIRDGWGRRRISRAAAAAETIAEGVGIRPFIGFVGRKQTRPINCYTGNPWSSLPETKRWPVSLPCGSKRRAQHSTARSPSSHSNEINLPQHCKVVLLHRNIQQQKCLMQKNHIVPLTQLVPALRFSTWITNQQKEIIVLCTTTDYGARAHVLSQEKGDRDRGYLPPTSRNIIICWFFRHHI